MENWGLVTYREVRLLVDPDKSSTRQTADVALVVAHELAHFWFGNLVTMVNYIKYFFICIFYEHFLPRFKKL